MNVLINRNLHLFHYGIRSVAFFIFLTVTLFYIPLYTATLPPFPHSYSSSSTSSSSVLTDKNNNNTKSKSNDDDNYAMMVMMKRKRRTLDISVSMRVCFEILAPSSEIGLHPPALIMSMCQGRIPPTLLVTGDLTTSSSTMASTNNDYDDDVKQEEGEHDRREENNNDGKKKKKNTNKFVADNNVYRLRPEDRPYVQKVLRHFSSVVVLHDVAYILYETTMKNLEKNDNTNKFRHCDESSASSSSSSSASIFERVFNSLDFWFSHFPVALFWAFIKNANQFLKVVEAVNWLRLLPSLTFLSPQVRGGILTFYLLCLFTKVPCSVFEISFAFHFCAFVALLEWVGAIADRFVFISNANINNNNNNNADDGQQLQHPQRNTNNTNNNNPIDMLVALFTSRYNRRIVMQEVFGYLALQIFVPPVAAGFVLSGLVALAVIVVN